MDIMNAKIGTIIRHKRTGATYVLGDYVNGVARELCNCNYLSTDYINRNTQEDYEITGAVQKED